jgi:hypothetical protein
VMVALLKLLEEKVVVEISVTPPALSVSTAIPLNAVIL